MTFDIVVIGGGHAGIEAAYIGALRGRTVLLVTSHVDMVGQMSCNPAVGGIAKGNIVREVDALGGVQGKLIDRSGIHFRMLNTSKGAAVWGNRAQADKASYRLWARRYLQEQNDLWILQGMVTGLRVRGGQVCAIVMDSGEKIATKCVVLAMGTFLNGTIHIGLESFPGGRTGEPPALGLTESLAELGIASGRLKTGTPPRIDGRTIDRAVMEEQRGDSQPWPFSFSTLTMPANRVSCWTTKSNSLTHAVIRENLDRSPLYTGKIRSAGPRYCPSIEDKVVRFGDRDGHALFLEPEGLDTTEMYLNGLSTSLPFDVQIQMVRSVRGLEKARIVRPGYGIEYDFFDPLQLHPTLESKIVENLFFAGQINGTSGYEEAACQGLVAGINAVERILDGEPLVLGRHQGYTGVLIDDLVTKGTQEPYRMFTSRAEYRLLLRQDNADERLMPLAFDRGLVDRETYDSRRRVWEEKQRWIERLGETRVEPAQWGEGVARTIRAHELLKRPEVCIEDIERVIGLDLGSRELRLGVESDIKYEGFIAKQQEQIERQRRNEETPIPQGIDYEKIPGLLAESRDKLRMASPGSVGRASRIPGVTPADIGVLLIHLAKRAENNVSRETVGL